MSERGMKKWAPYKSLVEHMPSVYEMFDKQNEIERPFISGDIKEEINDILVHYKQEKLLIKYYENKRINYVESIITKIDPLNKFIRLEDHKRIDFVNLLMLEKI